MSGITYPTTYHLDEEYEAIKKNASEYLSEYLAYPNLITFNDFDKSVTFSTEKLFQLLPQIDRESCFCSQTPIHTPFIKACFYHPIREVWRMLSGL